MRDGWVCNLHDSFVDIYKEGVDNPDNERSKRHAAVITKTLRGCAKKDKMQVCANLLTVLDQLVIDKTKKPQHATNTEEAIDKAEDDDSADEKDDSHTIDAAQQEKDAIQLEKMRRQRFEILSELANSSEFAFRTILEAVSRQANEVKAEYAVKEKDGAVTKQSLNESAANKVDHLVQRFIHRMEQGMKAKWKFSHWLELLKREKDSTEKVTPEEVIGPASVTPSGPTFSKRSRGSGTLSQADFPV